MVLGGCHKTSPEPIATQSFNIENIKLNQRVSREIAIPAGQYAIIRVEGQSAEFTASYSDESTENPFAVSLLYFRLHPLFLTVQPADQQRNILLHLDPDRTTKMGSARVQVSFFSTESAADSIQLEAYTLLSSGLATGDVSFEHRAGNLDRAHELLNDIGRSEDALWANFFRAYVTYWFPFDLPTALSLAEYVAEESEQHAYTRLHLASLQLLGAILIERGKDTPEVAIQKARRGQAILKDVQDLANAQGLLFESAWALNNSGIGYFYQKNYDKALEQYDAAFKISQALGDDTVSQMILGNRVLAAESSGQYFEAIAAMEKVLDFLADANDPLLHAGILRELGRLNRIVANYPRSVNYLAEAQRMYLAEEDFAGEGRTLISLGIAHMQMGRFEIARAQFELGLEKIDQNGSGIELRDVIRYLAQIERRDGSAERVSQLRHRQSNYLDTPVDEAVYQYDLAMDMVAFDEPQKAEQYLKNCSSRDELESDQEFVQFCKLRLAHHRMKSDRNAVDINEIRLLATQVMESSNISRALTSQQLLAEIEYESGNISEALEVSANLVEKMMFYRSTLPGVMGAWYWERRKNILEFYFNRFMDSQETADDFAEANFLAYMKLQNLAVQGANEGTLESSTGADTTINRKIRELMAKITTASSKSERLSLQNQLDAVLLEAARQSDSSAFELEDLQRLIATLPEDVGIITYYFGEQKSTAWLLSSSGIEQVNLLHGHEIYAKLETAKTNFRVVGDQLRQYAKLDDLGKSLLMVFSKDLPHDLYFLTNGPLTGFPPDALRLNGKFISETHNVAQVLDIRQFRPSSPGAVEQGPTKEVLLAGNPVGQDHNDVRLPATSRELEKISNIFDSSNITRLEGRQLTLNSLVSAIGDSPELVHIASHATLNLEYPELSSILLSMPSSSSSPTNAFSRHLMPNDINGIELNGSLVVLSACETAGNQRFSFDSNLGFVSGFLNAGAGSVVASLWPVGDRFAYNFMSVFYAMLSEGKTPTEALTFTKRAMISDTGHDNMSQWAAFQLFQD